ncbi:hypothetical protein C8F01DRAFT_1135059 [Mycena amicta]|nr:hypothetical protein C8F01DRAFT_1135059 [Mycena amicta]
MPAIRTQGYSLLNEGRLPELGSKPLKMPTSAQIDELRRKRYPTMSAEYIEAKWKREVERFEGDIRQTYQAWELYIPCIEHREERIYSHKTPPPGINLEHKDVGPYRIFWHPKYAVSAKATTFRWAFYIGRAHQAENHIIDWQDKAEKIDVAVKRRNSTNWMPLLYVLQAEAYVQVRIVKYDRVKTKGQRRVMSTHTITLPSPPPEYLPDDYAHPK